MLENGTHNFLEWNGAKKKNDNVISVLSTIFDSILFICSIIHTNRLNTNEFSLTLKHHHTVSIANLFFSLSLLTFHHRILYIFHSSLSWFGYYRCTFKYIIGPSPDIAFNLQFSFEIFNIKRKEIDCCVTAAHKNHFI